MPARVWAVGGLILAGLVLAYFALTVFVPQDEAGAGDEVVADTPAVAGLPTPAQADAPAPAADAGGGRGPVPALPEAASDETFFTAEQAARGAAAHEEFCDSCHGLSRPVSVAFWRPHLADFYDFISTAMPQDAPGSLPRQTYADIIAYLLRESGLPAGEVELTPDPAVLARIVVGRSGGE